MSKALRWKVKASLAALVGFLVVVGIGLLLSRAAADAAGFLTSFAAVTGIVFGLALYGIWTRAEI